MYHYLTGAASWYMLTMITEAFGVRGKAGDLLICPKLVKEQFDEEGNASICLTFAGKDFEVVYHNPDKLEYGSYEITQAVCDEKSAAHAECTVVVDKNAVTKMSAGKHRIDVYLAGKTEQTV